MANIRFQYSYTTHERLRRNTEIIFPNPDNLSLGEVEYGIKSRLKAGEQFDPYDFMVPALYGEYADFNVNSRLHNFDGIFTTTENPTDKRNIADFLAGIK